MAQAPLAEPPVRMCSLRGEGVRIPFFPVLGPFLFSAWFCRFLIVMGPTVSALWGSSAMDLPFPDQPLDHPPPSRLATRLPTILPWSQPRRHGEGAAAGCPEAWIPARPACL